MAEGRPSRLRVLRPEVEEVLKSPRRARPKLVSPQHKEEEGPRYDCAFQDEEKVGFAAPDMVWCKVRSHPWWPAQVFDAADASDLALQHATKLGAPLVAYFWDRTFAWSDPSALRPFRAHFPRLSGQSTLSSYAASVDAALQEVTRRIEAGLSCACSPPSVARKQEIHNSGIREGAYGAVVDDAYTRDTFRAKPFLDYISALGRSPLAAADCLDLTIAKAQLRSFNRSRATMEELPEFVIYQGIEIDDVAAAEVAPTPVLTKTKRKRTEKSGDAPAKEKRSRRGDSSSRKRDAAKEQDDAIDWKSSARNRIIDTSMDSYKKVEGSSKSKRVSKSAAERKKKHTSKDAADKGESLPEAEPAKEDDVGEDSSMPSVEAADDTLSKGSKSKISRSQAKAKKNDTSKDANEGGENEDSSMPNAEAIDDTVSKGRKSKNSTRSAKTKKKDADNKVEPAIKEATVDDSSTPSREKKSSKSSAKTKKKKDADKKVALPEPAIEEATGDDSCMPSRKKNSSKSSAKKKKKKVQDTSKDADGAETANKMAVDVILSEGKSARRLRSSHKMEEALEGKKDAGETTQGKGKDAALPKENNLWSRAGSARHKDKITVTEDGDGLADGSVKDPVSPGKKKLQLGVHSVTDNVPYSISEYGRKKKTLVELMAETATPNRSAGGKSKARAKPPLPSSTLKPEDPDLDKKATPNTRGKHSLPSTEKPADPGRDKNATKTREKRSLPASTEKSERDTISTMKTREKRSLPTSVEEPEDPDHDKKDAMKTRGKRSLPESTEDPDRDTKGTSKTKGKHSLPESTEEPEYPDDRDMKDTMQTRKRKKLENLGDLSSQPQPLSPKGSTKAREVKRKAAGQKPQVSPVVKANGGISGDSSSQPEPMSPKRSARRKAAELKPQTSPVVKANGEASQTRSCRAKNSEVAVPDKPPRSVKLDKGKKGALEEDTPSCGEMLSQLCIGASDLKKIGKITPTSASFLTDFLKSARACTSDVEKAANEDSVAFSPSADEEIPEKAAEKVSSPHVDEEIPEKATDNVSSPHADEEISEKAADKVSSPHAYEVIAEEAVEKVPTPHADEEVPEEAAEKVSSPYADEVIPEEAAEKVSSPHADEAIPEEVADKVSSPHADEAIPKAAEKVSSPNADEAIPEKAADEVSSAPADEQTLEKATEKVSSPYADEVKLEEAAEKVSSPHADEAIPEKAADEISSPPAGVETPEKAAEKVSCTPTDEEIAEKAADEVSSTRADVETPEKAAKEVPSPHADEEIAEKAANKVSSPHADEEMAEKAAEEVPGPHAEEEMAEKAAEEVPSPHAVEEMAEKATNSEPAPSGPPVADHMKDDYWADILINVEEPISSLIKKGKSKMRSSKKQHQADDTAAKESPVTVVSVEEPKAESQQDNTKDNGKVEAAMNGGGQANTATEDAENNTSLTGLVLHFSKPGAVPSRSDLIKIFSQYGPVSEARTETDEHVSSAQVVFRRRMDAEAAFGGAGKIAALGPGLVSFRLTDFPCAEAAASAFMGDEHQQE